MKLEADMKVKSKSATQIQGRNKSEESDQEEEEEDDEDKDNNQEKNKKDSKGSKNKRVDSQKQSQSKKNPIENIQELELNEENQFLSFIQINDIDINNYVQETQVFQDNFQDFNHNYYHQTLQDKIKLKENEYFSKLSLEFYHEQRIPQNEYLELKHMLIKQKEIYEKQPCVNVNNLLSFENKLCQLDKLWQEIKADLANNQIKLKQDEIQFIKKKNLKISGDISQNQGNNQDDLNYFENDNRVYEQQDVDASYKDDYKENCDLNENNKNLNQTILLNKQNISINKVNNIQRVNYQFIKPGKKINGVKTEHSPSNFRDNPYMINLKNESGNENLSREENIQGHAISSSSQSPNSRNKIQKSHQQNDQQIQKMYAPFNINKTNQTMNGYQNNTNEVSTYPRVKSSAIRGYSPVKQNNQNNVNTRSIKVREHQLNLGQNARESINNRGEYNNNNNIETNTNNNNVEIISRKNTFIKKQNTPNQGNLSQNNQKIKVIVSDVNDNNAQNKSSSPPNKNKPLPNQISQSSSSQRTNFIISKPPSIKDNSSHNLKIQTNSSPIKKNPNQNFRITSNQKESNPQITRSPQQIKLTTSIQGNKIRPNSPNSIKIRNKNE